MSVRLVDHAKVRTFGECAGEFEPEARCERVAGHRLYAGQHRLVGGNAVCDDPIAVFSILMIEDHQTVHGTPEGLVTKGSQPVLHVINRRKRLHSSIVPNRLQAAQILRSSPDA